MLQPTCDHFLLAPPQACAIFPVKLAEIGYNENCCNVGNTTEESDVKYAETD